jgi:hypothetical protein
VADLFRVRLSEAIVEVEREIGLRRRYYPRAISNHTMSRLSANSHLGRLEAARDFLVELRAIKGEDYEHNSGSMAG